MNRLPSRRFIWNVKSYLLWKLIKSIFKCRLLEICLALLGLRYIRQAYRLRSACESWTEYVLIVCLNVIFYLEGRKLLKLQEVKVISNSLKYAFKTTFPACTQRQSIHQCYQCFDYKENNTVTFCLLSWTPRPLWKGVFSIQKCFHWEQYILSFKSKPLFSEGGVFFLLNQFSEGRWNNLTELHP